MVDGTVLLQICNVVVAHPQLKAFSIEDIYQTLYDLCLDQLRELFASNFNLLDIFLCASDSYGSNNHFEWITNRNKIYKKQQRFKIVKPAQP